MLGVVATAGAACGSGGSGDEAGKCSDCPTYGASDTKIRVDAEQDVVIALDSNPTTGYRWEVTAVSDPEVVRMTADTYVAPKRGDPGASGQQRLEFAADRPGTTTLTVRYARSFEPNDPTVRVIVYNVTVH